MSAPWYELLKDARLNAGVAASALAARAGVSVKTIWNYEHGHVTPRRERLLHLCAEMQLPRDVVNRILDAAGIELLPTGKLSDLEHRRVPLEHLRAEIAGYRWPCLIQNEDMEIMAWNEPAMRVAEMDFAVVLPQLHQRNLMRIAAMKHFTDRTLNWDHIVGTMVRMLKSDHFDIQHPGEDSPYFLRLVNELYAAGPIFWEFVRLWMTIPFDEEDFRIWLRPHWKLSDGTELLFNAIVSSWSDFDAAWAFDWHPADATTWRWLDATASAAASDPPAAAEDAFSSGHTWNELLRLAREAVGLSRAQVAATAYVSPEVVDKYENGRSREPDRDILLAMLRACEANGALRNVILDRAGLGIMPSEWSRLLAGEPIRTRARFRYRDELASWVERTNVRQHLEAYPFPALLVNDRCDIINWNRPMALVIGEAGQQELRGRATRNVVRFVTGAFLRRHALNWPEIVTALVPADLRRRISGQSRTHSRYIERLAAVIEEEDPVALRELETLWSAAPPALLTTRVVVPLHWQADDGSLLSFTCIISPWTVISGLWAIDWHPANAETWEWLAAQPG